MVYSIIFRYIGENVEEKRSFNLNNLGMIINFDNLIDFEQNEKYIEGRSKILRYNKEYIIKDKYLEIETNEITCSFGLISVDENDEMENQKKLSEYSRYSTILGGKSWK